MKVGTEVFASREEALAQIKRDLGIPRCQEPIKQEMVKLRDETGNPILDESKNIVYSRQLTYSVENQFDAGGRPITEVIIQDHSYGHEYSSGIGNQGPHYNVRPGINTKNGKVQGLREHYYFDYRNRK